MEKVNDYLDPPPLMIVTFFNLGKQNYVPQNFMIKKEFFDTQPIFFYPTPPKNKSPPFFVRPPQFSFTTHALIFFSPTHQIFSHAPMIFFVLLPPKESTSYFEVPIELWDRSHR